MANLPTSNNNPGDLRNVGQAGASQGKGGFASFSNPQEGFGALLNDLQTKINNHPEHTLADFANQYAPPSDNNDSAGYAAKLANQLKVPPNATIGSLKGNIGGFAEAVASNEGYQGLTKSSIVPTANADSGASGTSSSGTGLSWLDAILGIGAGAIGAGVGIAKQYGKTALTDVGAGLGAAGGTMVEPGLGTAAGGVAGAAAGAGLADAFGLGGNGNQPSDNISSETTVPQPNPDSNLMGEGNQVSSHHVDFTKAAQASQTVQQGYSDALQGTQGGRIFANSDQGKETLAAAGHYGLTPSIDENGTFNFTDYEKKREDILSTLAKSEKQFIVAEGEKGSMASVANHAAQYLGRDTRLTPNERKEAVDKMRNEVQSYAPLNGSMQLGDMVEARHQQYGATKGKYGIKTTGEIAAHKAAAYGFRQAIGQNTKNKPLYESLLKEESKLIRAKEIAKKLHGKKAPKNNAMWQSFLKSSAKYAEIYIGDKLGGPLGAILGAMTGEHINRAIEKKFGKTTFETKGMREAFDILETTEPKMYSVLREKLAKEGINIKAQKSEGREGSVNGLIKRKPTLSGIGLVDRELHGDKKPD